ncbi:MAG: NADH-quinone oxidoreductase subunit M [Chloroflexota bacterium]|nr:NADH-quinone oxidoreductase subunit M [Chloroflexota bacterium]
MDSWVLTLITLTPLVGALTILFINKESERTIKRIAVAVSIIPLLLSVWVFADYWSNNIQTGIGGMAYVVDIDWIPQLDVGYTLGADGLSIPLIFLTTLLSSLGLYYSSFVVKTRVKEFFFLFLLLEMGMLGVFVALDFVLFYVFWEIGLVPMFFLIGIWGRPADRPRYAAIKFFLYTLVGSVAMLLAILGIYFETGTFNMIEAAIAQPWADNLVIASLAFWGFMLAFMIKVPSFPFHTWLPDAHTAAPTAGSVILAGVLLKLGAYGIIRIVLPTFPTAFSYWALAIVILGVIGIVYGAFICIAQTDLKRLIAYSSVSHMGYVMLGLGAAAYGIKSIDQYAESMAMAINGATLQMFVHGIITGGLFFLVGVLYERAHTRDLGRFGGLSSKMPYFYAIMMVTAFASLGLPGLAGFWAEFFTFRGAFDIVSVWAAIGVIGIVATAAYILWRIIQSVFLGEYDPEKIDHWTDLSDGEEKPMPTDMLGFEKITMWPLVILMVLIGIYPVPLLDFFNSASTNLVATLSAVTIALH